MPRKSAWLHRLEEILEVLPSVPHQVLGRAEIEKLFVVSSRQAIRILHRLGAHPSGGAWVIGRKELEEKLAALLEDDQVVFERERRQRLTEKLQQEARIRRTRQVEIPAAPYQGIEMLPPEVRFTRDGQLTVEFNTPVELLQRLLLLAQAASEDWDEFSALVTAGKVNGSRRV